MTFDLAVTYSGTPGPLTTLAAVATAVVLCLLPGYGLVRIGLPQAGRLTALAAGPAVTAGVLYTVGQVLSLLSIPVNAWLGLVAVAVGLTTTVVAEQRRRRESGSQPWNTARLLLPTAALLGTLVGAALWAAGIGSLGAVPPHHDGMHHGLFVAQIVNTGSLEPGRIVVADVLTSSPLAAYYPFALHEQAAMVVQATGIGVAPAFTLVSLTVLLVALPAGMVVLTRRIFPGRPLVAGMAGLVAVLVPGLTYSTSWWGGYAMAAGLAVMLGALELLLGLGPRLRPVGILLAALAIAGVTGVHTSELPLLAILAAGLALGEASKNGWLKDATRRVAVVTVPFVVALVLLGPALAQMVGGYTERQFPVAAVSVSLTQALSEVFALLVFVPPPTPAAIVLTFWVGIIAAVAMRRGRAWAALWLSFAVLYVWLWSFPSPLVNTLTAFWYSDPFRLAYILVLLAVPFIAFALGAPLQAWRDGRLTGSSSRAPLLAATALVMFVALAATGGVSSVATVRQNYQTFSLVDADARRAFVFLAGQTRKGERVLNQHQDGSTWMYALYGVAPLIPAKSTEDPVWRDKLYLVRHAADIDTNPRAAALAQQYQTRLVYVNDTKFARDVREFSSADMRGSTAYRQVFKSGGAHVFERVNS